MELLAATLGVLVFQLSPLPPRWLNRQAELLERRDALWTVLCLSCLNTPCWPDPANRTELARVIAATAAAGHPVFVTINNKAEGSAPLSVFELARQLAL